MGSKQYQKHFCNLIIVALLENLFTFAKADFVLISSAPAWLVVYKGT